MTRLIAIALLLAACDQPRSLSDDTDQPLTEPSSSATPTHGYWALRAWPTLVLDTAGSCPEEAVDAALAPFHAAGIDVTYEPGECHPDSWHIEDGRVCLSLVEDLGPAGNAWWRYHPGTTDLITSGGIRVYRCNPMLIAHELGHVLGLDHSEDNGNTMYPDETDVLHFDASDLRSIVAKHDAHPRL